MIPRVGFCDWNFVPLSLEFGCWEHAPNSQICLKRDGDLRLSERFWDGRWARVIMLNWSQRQLRKNGGPGGIRTRNPAREPASKAGAYTDFATGPPWWRRRESNPKGRD